jgi:hypothetical protein
MTTYIHRLTLGDGDLIALEAAISRYIDTCRAELVNGPKAPYWAHLRSLEDIQSRLYSDSAMTSTSSPCWPDLPTLAPKKSE